MTAGLASMRTHSSTPSTKADGFRRIEVITGVGRRRRWTDEEKAWIVAESLDPATTASAVARRYGLHASTSGPSAAHCSSVNVTRPSRQLTGRRQMGAILKR